MDLDAISAERTRLNQLMTDQDAFFDRFGRLDGEVYADGAIPKLCKELIGLSISVLTTCDECVVYHLGGALDAGAESNQIIEAIRTGVIGGGSITYPTARYAFSVLDELAVLDDEN